MQQLIAFLSMSSSDMALSDLLDILYTFSSMPTKWQNDEQQPRVVF